MRDCSRGSEPAVSCRESNGTEGDALAINFLCGRSNPEPTAVLTGSVKCIYIHMYKS
jgi:hypothetical protein